MPYTVFGFTDDNPDKVQSVATFPTLPDAIAYAERDELAECVEDAGGRVVWTWGDYAEWDHAEEAD